MKVTVMDYGLSNLLSVERALTFCGAEVEITDSPAAVRAAGALVLPGVGAFADGMAGLEKLGLLPAIRERAAAGVPLLGICLGMQMLFDESDEFGLHRGLGLIPGRVERIPAADTANLPQRVPHIGWDPLLIPKQGVLGGSPDHFAGTALARVAPGDECYFVHSYEAKPAKAEFRLADTLYGGRRVCAAAARGCVLGTQFHPEKSGPVGLSILREFLVLCEKA